MAEQPNSVWAEARITEEGVSITLYSEAPYDTPVVEDEVWLTQSEIESQSPSGVFSLHLSSETRQSLSGDLQVDEESDTTLTDDEIEETLAQVFDAESKDSEETVGYAVPEVGDWQTDGNPPDWSEGEPLVLITEVTDDTAEEHAFSQPEGKLFNSNTVANVNLSEPEDAPVVKGRYYREGKGLSDEEYAFPVTRLSEPDKSYDPLPKPPELACPECDTLHVQDNDDSGLACSECGALLKWLA